MKPAIILRKLMLLLAMLSAWPALSAAEGFQLDGIWYHITDASKAEVEVSMNLHYTGNAIIPKEVVYDSITYTVTALGYGAFYWCYDLTSIEIPESVTSIGEKAFYHCYGLTSIEIPETVTSIGNEAFSYCIALSSIKIPGSVTSIGNYAFSGCSGLTSIKNMDGVTSIADYAFQDCSGLTSIEIPGSVTSIGNYAFYGCSNLTSIAFEDGESELVDYSKTYDDHTAYSYVYLGRILTSPANFPGQNIQTFEFGENISSIQKALFQGRTVCDMILSSGMQSINSEDLPAGLESICLKSGTYNPVPTSFRGELRGINPETTLEMASNPDFDPFGRLTYKEDNKYYSILIWNRPIDATGAYYINDAGALIPENQPCTLRTHYADGCILHNGEDVTDRVTSDEGYTLTPSSARYRDKILTIDSTNLRNVTLQNAGSLFNELGLDQIQAAEGLVITGNINGTDVMTLNRMPKLKYLDLTDANIVNGGMTYRDNLKTSDNTIGSYFFNSLSNLVVLKLPKSITTIEDNAFNGCSSLASLTIPGNCVSMGKSLFTGCEKLYKITFEKGEANLNASGDLCGVNTYEVYLSRNIVNGRFTNSLRKLVIGDGASALDNYIIYPCKNITELIIENGPFLSMTRLINFPSCQLKTVYIGRGIDISFASFNSIESVRINNGSIPSKCFSSNKSLKTVEISGECTIGSYAFNGCSALKELSISGNGTIGSYAFNGCSALKELSISGNGVIENSCFYGCTLLDNINFCGIGKYSFYYDAFDACESQRNVAIDDLTAWCKLDFSNGKSNPLAYNANLILNGETVTDLVIPETIDKINGYAFYGSTIKSLIVNDNIKSIGACAFSESKLLQSAKLSNNVANIGSGAFTGCTALTDAVLSNGIREIVDMTFAGCTALESVLIGKNTTKISDTAFQNCTNINKIRSLNPTPPVITSKVFESVDKETCQLVVTKGNLVYYWLDPVWKEFLNMNDNMLALNPLPAMRYGDDPLDLSTYAPEGVTLSYESSDNSVARLNGSTLSIVGAGEATIGASYPEAGTPMEIIGQMRQLIIDKADLDVALEQEVYEIMQGEAFPAFGLTYSGLCYDDSASDIDELPSIVCEAENTATPGEYAINLEGGNDRNYNFHTKAARLIIHESSGVENVSSDNDVRCYGLNGRLTVEGAPVNAIVNIYRFDGSLCHSAKSDGTAMTFEVANNGFYIVIVNGKPYRLKI